MNGTTGVVEDVVWAPGCTRSDLPLAVLVACPTYTGPTLWRTAPSVDHPMGVPIIPFTPLKAMFELKSKTLVRPQLPLRLAWAVTVHKSQGLTLDLVRISLGSKEFCLGLTFIALSRAKSLDKLLLVDQVDYSHVKNLGGKGLQYRQQNIARRYPSQ